jgi:hypothetical protein
VRFPSALVLAALSAPAFVAVVLAFAVDPAAQRAADPLLHDRGGFAGSPTCVACHPDQHASWRRTHHAQMTQKPGPDTVQGAFDGRPVRYEGQQARSVPRR